MKTQKTLVVDDHKLFRKGLCFILDDFDFIEIVAQADDGEEFLRILPEYMPDIVFMDIKMPKINGIEATKKALEKYPELNIIALSMYGDIEYYNKMLDAGVKGFLLKNTDIDELERALRTIIDGNTYFSQELLMKLVKTYQSESHAEKINLTKRELEVLQYICKGYSNAEIAQKMYLSPRTIETHRANLLNKTNSKNSIHLVIYAIKNNLYKID